MKESFDLIVVGTGFAGSFFLHRYLQRFGEGRRILVLERGTRKSHAWRIQSGRQADLDSKATFVNDTPKKHWQFQVTFGGSSNCWWACTPRFMPSDFRTRSEYGVALDWPLSYDDLEESYCDAEDILAVSGPEITPYPRSRPYPLPPHYMTDPEKVLQKAFGSQFISMPSARWSMHPRSPARAQCRALGRCTFCPIDAKFTIENSLSHLYETPGVDLRLQRRALSVDVESSVARGVTYIDETTGKVHTAQADLVVLGANAIFNPFLLLQSGIERPLLGRRLGEQTSTHVQVNLKGIESYQGSTSLTGHGYMLHDGEHRSDSAGVLLETSNVPRFRVEQNRWREVMFIKCIVETLPDENNLVGVRKEAGGDDLIDAVPFTRYGSIGAYTERAFDRLPGDLERVLTPLPVEDIQIIGRSVTEAHIAGSTVMGNDPETSVLDRNLAVHGIPNLLVLGSSAFVTCPPANPTLTLSALALWAADRI
jgi:choline dehydrogenase-like flavoprotein